MIPSKAMCQVPGNLVISAHSGVHSFDPSQINVSHVMSLLSFGKKLSTRMLTEVKRLTPYLGGSIDRLTGRAYITNHADQNTNVTVFSRRSSPELLFREYEYTGY
ncbi:protein disulfide isomerase-like 5-4 [Tasmannia lanceolata]|uniref:protein disulfide isomerase-like 5-4 n=1 Tax=Tasmannia lanceolata TaxID=3420 RepID=UPI004063C61E